jgi:glycosyltransferase involved in cell wall biosynthesis
VTTVSVVVPCYNAGKTLHACLASVAAQTRRPHEVIVVDDASTDRSARIAAGFGATVLAQPVNRGVSAARNAGAAAATGQVLFFLDSDVALAPDAVENAVRELAADPGCGCVYGVYDKRPLVDDGTVEAYRVLHLHCVLTRAVGLTATAVFALAAVPRAVFAEVGPFDENLRSAEDDEYSERLGRRYRIRLSGEVVGYHDEVDRLGPMLREQFRRAQLLRFAARHRLRRGALKVNRGTGVAAAALSVTTLPLALVRPALAAVPALALALFAVADPAMSRFVLRERGARFLAVFTGLHWLVNIALLAGAAAGWLRAAADPAFGPTARRGTP